MNPITRKEIFYAKAANEYDGDTPEPVTREELYLNKIADNINSLLPDVTAEDNGKVLGVEDGAWTKATPPSEIYRFSATAAAGPDDSDRTVTLGNGETYANLNSKKNTHIIVCKLQDNGMAKTIDVILGYDQGGLFGFYISSDTKIVKLTITSSSVKAHTYVKS